MSDVTLTPAEIEAGAAVISQIEWAKVGVTQTAAIGRGDRYAAKEVLAAVLPLYRDRLITELADEAHERGRNLYTPNATSEWLRSKVQQGEIVAVTGFVDGAIEPVEVGAPLKAGDIVYREGGSNV